MRNQKTRILVEAALMVALAVLLNMIKVYTLPTGGSITAAAMAPIVLLSVRRGWKWGLLGSGATALLQMLMDGVLVPAGEGLGQFVGVLLLDYILAFMVLGLAGLFAKPMGQRAFAVPVASCCVTLLRYLCHFTSGIVLWGAYAPEGTPVWLYSLTYNGSYMIPETIITALVVTILYNTLRKQVRA